ncbi:hypothetical protein LQW54_008172 [Pestalotiopsis sp. IQ-011]
MYFSKLAVLLAAATSAQCALTFQKYNDFQISSGTAGNALEEAKAAFPVSSDLASTSDSDLSILKAARETAEAAETDAFNDEVDAASGDAATALQNGKIKNKVLKLYLETTALQIEQAQGDDNQSQIDAEQTKLDTNVALDEKAAGEASTAVNFTGDVQPDN